MNWLCNPIQGGQIEAYKKLIEKHHVENLYVIQFDEDVLELKESAISSVIREIYFFSEVQHALYSKYVFYSEMKPLDKEILDYMALYQGEAMEMMERAGQKEDLIEIFFMKYFEHVMYWNTMLDLAKIDLFIPKAVPHSIYDYFIMRLCQYKKIPIVMTELAPIQTSFRLLVFNDYETFNQEIVDKIDRYSREDNITLPDDLEQEYELFMGTREKIVPVYVGPKNIFVNHIKLFIRLCKHISWKNAVNRIGLHFNNKLYVKNMLRYYERLAAKPDLKKVPYVFFALHYQPELTTCPLGGWFVHQYLAIRMLSYYLPEGVYLYVKEHPALKNLPENTRLQEHYRNIERLQNVVLISLDIESESLIENAIAVASITGSVGYESMYLHKPYLMFGNQIMKYAKGTFNIRTNEDCERAIKEIFENGFNYGDKEVKAFLKVIGESTVPFQFVNGEQLFDKEGAQKYADFLSTQIELCVKKE